MNKQKTDWEKDVNYIDFKTDTDAVAYVKWVKKLLQQLRDFGYCFDTFEISGVIPYGLEKSK